MHLAVLILVGLISTSLASFQLKGYSSGKCQAITGAYLTDGATDVLWQCVSSGAGEFESFDNIPVDPKYNLNGEVYFQIRAKHSGKCLTPTGGDAATGNGPQIIQWPCGAANTVLSQMWTYVPSKIYPGFSMIKARHSGRCMLVTGGSLENGAGIVQWDCSDAGFAVWEPRACMVEFMASNTTAFNEYLKLVMKS